MSCVHEQNCRLKVQVKQNSLISGAGLVIVYLRPDGSSHYLVCRLLLLNHQAHTLDNQILLQDLKAISILEVVARQKRDITKAIT